MNHASSNDTAPDVSGDSRQAQAQAIVRKNALWAAGAGIVPIPLLDLAAITAVQVKMIKELSSLYDVRFMEHKVKNMMASLIGGGGSVALGDGIVQSLFKMIPIVGHALGAVALPASASAVTYAMGQVFVQHFETGGTLLEFDAVKIRQHFVQELGAAKASAASFMGSKTKSTT